VLSSTVWFLSGIGHTLISILTGLFAEEAERGKVFGNLELTTGLAAVFSGLTFGRIADTWGFPSLCVFTGFLWILFPLIGLRITGSSHRPGRSREGVRRGRQYRQG